MRLINNEKIDIKEVITLLKEPLDMYASISIIFIISVFRYIDALDPENEEDLSNLEPDGINLFSV
jgi:hypothetical protein